MFFKKARRGLIIELNPHRTLVAGLAAWDDRPLLIDCMAEFEAADREGLRRWLQSKHERSFVPAYCSFAPPDWQLVRESISPRRLAEPNYLTELARDRLKLVSPQEWQLHLLHPLEGELVEAAGATRPVLISAVPHAAVRETQQLLLDLGVMPYRLEVGVLPTIGAILAYNDRRDDKRACVMLQIGAEESTAWILGKEGVHTPSPLKIGYTSIEKLAMKEFALVDAAEVHSRLQTVEEELLLRATRLVRPLVRELKPILDSYELTTGQRVGELFCSSLPAWLSWITEPLAGGTGLEPFAIDCNEWLQTAGLRADPELIFSPKWFSLLALVAEPDSQQAHGQP
jgi:hypothetical protein